MSNPTLAQRIALVRDQVTPAVGHTDSLLKNILSLIDGVVGDVSRMGNRLDTVEANPRGDIASRLQAVEAKQLADGQRLNALGTDVANLGAQVTGMQDRFLLEAANAADRVRQELLGLLNRETTAINNRIDALTAQCVSLDGRLSSLESNTSARPRPSPTAPPAATATRTDGDSSDAIAALRSDLEAHRAATRQGMADAKAADDALRADLDSVAEAVVAKAEHEHVAGLQVEVEAHAAAIAALRELIDDLAGLRRGADGAAFGGGGVSDAALGEIGAQLAAMRKEKADIGWVKGAIARLQRDKADRKELKALAGDGENITAGAYRCLSCNRGSSGLYKTFPEVSVASQSVAPAIPWVGPRAPSPPNPHGPSQSNFPRRATRATAAPPSPSTGTTPGRIRPSTAAPSTGGASTVGRGAPGGFSAPADSSAKDRYYAYHQWAETANASARAAGASASGVAVGMGAGMASVPLTDGPTYQTDGAGMPLAQDGQPTRKGIEFMTYAQTNPHHAARNAMHIGSDGKSYPNIEHPDHAAANGRYFDVPSQPQRSIASNDLLEGRGRVAANVTASGLRMAPG